MRIVVLFVIDVIMSAGFRQYLEGGKMSLSRPVIPVAQKAQQLLEGPPHVFVSEAVDDGIDKGIAFGQNQEVLLVAQHFTILAVETVEHQQNKAGGPAEHEEAC